MSGGKCPGGGGKCPGGESPDTVVGISLSDTAEFVRSYFVFKFIDFTVDAHGLVIHFQSFQSNGY